MKDYKLWDHQVRTIQGVKDSIRRGNKRIIIYLPTGGGKTLTTADIFKSAMAKGKKAGFVVNRKLLTDNFSNLLNDIGISHDILQGENSCITGSPVQVCTIQTMARRGFFPADIWCIDEVHFAPGSRDYRKFIFANKDKIILGFTGTPFAKGMSKTHEELDGEPLFQDMVIGATIPELIKAGVLVDLDIYCPSSPDMVGCKTSLNMLGERDYAHKDAEKRVNKVELIGSIVDHWIKHANNVKTFGFAHSIAHSKALATAFLERGIKADHIDGWHTEEERDEILSKFKSGETRVLFNSQILREGIDVPDAGVLILAKPTKSLISYIQMAGRVLRSSPGKEKALMLDHSGSAWTLGFPTDELPLDLDDGEKKETESKKKEVKEKAEVVCPKCKVMKKTLICQNCGFEPVINPNVTEKKGELVKLTKKQELSKDHTRLAGELNALAAKRGWSDNKMKAMYKEITGLWPQGSIIAPPITPSPDTLKMIQHINIKRSKSRYRHA